MNGRNTWMWASAALLCTTLVASYAAISYYTQAEASRRSYEALQRDLGGSYEALQRDLGALTILVRGSYEALQRDLGALTILVSLKIDYGNGTARWLNNTRLPLDTNLLNATKRVVRTDYSVSSFGAFVTKINGVGGDPKKFWLWFYHDHKTNKWTMGPVGADQWLLHNGDMVSWVYTAT